MMRILAQTVGAMALTWMPHLAFAHTGVSDTSGFVNGLMHPWSGLDHVLPLMATGLIAAQLGSRALWLVPASFVLYMVFAGAFGHHGIGVFNLGYSAGFTLGTALLHLVGMRLAGFTAREGALKPC